MRTKKPWMICKSLGKRSLRKKRKEKESFLSKLLSKGRISEFLTLLISMRILS
jgi:hypothetical protein